MLFFFDAVGDHLVLHLLTHSLPTRRSSDLLDRLFVRKLGAPGHEELGLGAVVDGADPQLVLNEDIVRDLAPSPNYLHAEMQRQLAEITRRREMYMHGIPPIDVARRTVILVDDGIATGGTVRAALKGLRKLGPARLIDRKSTRLNSSN